jgi:ATP-GRASP peptide maturase of grasp-with-spasm system
MILIYTQANDYSTDDVIDYLGYYNAPFKRVNGSDPIVDTSKAFSIDLSQSREQVYSSVWNRRPVRKMFNPSVTEEMLINPEREKAILPWIRITHSKNMNDASEYAVLNHPNAKTLGTFDKNDVNKHLVISAALSNGVDVPASIFTNSKADLIAFKNKFPAGIITKCNAVFMMDYDNNSKTMALYTEIVRDEMINELPELFFPTFFQEKLEKEFEIRTFYLNGKFFSMAMFTQRNAQTSVDFRRYDRENMNRRVPYQLPTALEQKLTAMMQEIGHNTGSMDIVKTKDGRLVFLEVNPVGQFGMTSVPCNYQLERHIAEYLIKP